MSVNSTTIINEYITCCKFMILIKRKTVFLIKELYYITYMFFYIAYINVNNIVKNIELNHLIN